MKFRTKKRKVNGTYTREGKTIPVTRTEATKVPVLPRDWQMIALVTAVVITGALTVLSIVWSTWSIGSLLSGGIGFAVAVVFDVGWGVSLLLEYLARYHEDKRRFPMTLGWLLLAMTMGAIFWHGASLHNWGMAIVGAAVSFFAKVLWIAVMKHINADLSEEDKQWVKAQVSEAQAKAAIASVRRQTARIEQSAALELLAMEKQRRDVSAAFGLDVATPEVEARPGIELTAPTLADMGKSDAIRFVKAQRPELTPAEIADVLDAHGVDAKAEYVAQVLNRKPKTELETEAEVIALRK